MNGKGIPLLGADPKAMRGATGVPVTLFRTLDEDACFIPERVNATPQGPQAIIGRANIVTAEELVEMIRVVVRKEIAAALDKKK